MVDCCIELATCVVDSVWEEIGCEVKFKAFFATIMNKDLKKNKINLPWDCSGELFCEKKIKINKQKINKNKD